MMRRLLITVFGLMMVGALAVLGHLAVIEVGREVVTLQTRSADGTLQKTRLWIVDDGEIAWLHSGGKDWGARFEGNPVVELQRAGNIHRYHATPTPGPHPRVHELLRSKYGLADRWVRFIGPDNDSTLAVRLERLEAGIEK